VINSAWDIDSSPNFRAIVFLPEATTVCVRDLVPVESEWADIFGREPPRQGGGAPWGHPVCVRVVDCSPGGRKSLPLQSNNYSRGWNGSKSSVKAASSLLQKAKYSATPRV